MRRACDDGNIVAGAALPLEIAAQTPTFANCPNVDEISMQG